VTKDSQSFPKRCGESHHLYYHSFQSNNGIACGSFAASLFFYFLIDEVLKMFYKLKPWALKTAAAATNIVIL
jgi:hypothetical protein